MLWIIEDRFVSWEGAWESTIAFIIYTSPHVAGYASNVISSYVDILDCDPMHIIYITSYYT